MLIQVIILRLFVAESTCHDDGRGEGGGAQWGPFGISNYSCLFMLLTCTCFESCIPVPVHSGSSTAGATVLTSASQPGHPPVLDALACCHVLCSFATSQPNMHHTLQPLQTPQLGITQSANPFLPLAR